MCKDIHVIHGYYYLSEIVHFQANVSICNPCALQTCHLNYSYVYYSVTFDLQQNYHDILQMHLLSLIPVFLLSFQYGFAPKGSSVILYANHELRRWQYSVVVDWPGGIYATPTIGGECSLCVLVGRQMTYMKQEHPMFLHEAHFCCKRCQRRLSMFTSQLLLAF